MNIIVKPIITEKTTKNSEVLNQYSFVVEKKANKIQIKNAIKAFYGVEPISVRTANYRADRVSKYTKNGLIHGKTNAYKKAIVQIPEGEIIDFQS